MAVKVEPRPVQETDPLAKEIRSNLAVVDAIREIVRDEMKTTKPRERRAGLPPSEMGAVMRRIEEVRQTLTWTAEDLEEILEEHGQEFGRGPLRDEPDAE